MLIDLHDLIIACESSDERIRERWSQSFSSRPKVVGRNADITFELRLASTVPLAPDTPPIFTQGDLLSVHQSPMTNNQLLITIHFSRFGQLRLDIANNRIEGELVPAALDMYGVFEDVVAMGLTALLRRRNLFLIHAFAAAYAGRAVLLVGDIGSGKTTTGISLLRAGWKLLSNDSPLLADCRLRIEDCGLSAASSESVVALAYPGLVSAYPETLQRFEELRGLTLTPDLSPLKGEGNMRRQKITFAAESVYRDVWLESAPVGAIVFPRVAHLAEHQVTRLKESDALRRLLPNAIDRWDTEMIPTHLQLLTTLANSAPAYQVELGEQVETLPALFERILGEMMGNNRPSNFP